MPEVPLGDPKVKELFGFPGFEALMRVNMKYVNVLREEQGMPELSWTEYLGEVITIMHDITNGTP